jgi:hypothetical protein
MLFLSQILLVNYRSILAKVLNCCSTAIEEIA